MIGQRTMSTFCLLNQDSNVCVCKVFRCPGRFPGTGHLVFAMLFGGRFHFRLSALPAQISPTVEMAQGYHFNSLSQNKAIDWLAQNGRPVVVLSLGQAAFPRWKKAILCTQGCP